MTIRALCRRVDRLLVATFFAGAQDYVLLETGHVSTRETVDEFFDERPPNVGVDDAVQLGLFEAEHLIGIISMTFGYPRPTDAYIGLLLMSEGMRGKGNGQRTLEQATSLAQARGARRQLIAVLDANPKGRAFWEREGFVLNQTFPPSDDRHTRHRMVRSI